MHSTGGPGWQITVNTSAAMLMALYLRDVAGLTGAGAPALSAARPAVRPADPRQLTQLVGGPDALRSEWEIWWADLVSRHGVAGRPDAQASFDFDSAPALQRVLTAHYGAAMEWTRERDAEYERLSTAREATGRNRVLDRLVEDREMELGRNARAFELAVIELPLAEPRAWYVEPDKLLMSQDLLDDEPTLRSFMQPVLEMLV